jgi:hypothetical protein
MRLVLVCRCRIILPHKKDVAELALSLQGECGKCRRRTNLRQTVIAAIAELDIYIYTWIYNKHRIALIHQLD